MRTLITLLSFLLLTGTALAEPTEIVVHVLSKGSKFIGTSMGGALVTLEDAVTGELLAHGYTEGGTGDTRLIMEEKHTTHTPVSTEDAAQLKAVLDLERPVLLRVTAQGPMTDADGNMSYIHPLWSDPRASPARNWRTHLVRCRDSWSNPNTRGSSSKIEGSRCLGSACFQKSDVKPAQAEIPKPVKQ